MTDTTTLTRTGRIVLVAACIAATPAVWAGSRHVERDAEGRRGGSAQLERDRSPGHAERDVEREGPRGRSMSGSRTRDYDADSGVYSSERARSRTGKDGQTASHGRTATRDGDSATVTRETTAPDGRTLSYERSRGDGHAEATWTGAEGQTATRTRDIERSDDAVTVERTLTGPDGQVRSSTRTYERTGGD